MSEGNKKEISQSLTSSHQRGTCREHPGPASNMQEGSYKDEETEPELLEPGLFTLNWSGAEVAGTFCSESEPGLSIMVSHALRSLRLCDQPSDDVGKKRLSGEWHHISSIGCSSRDRNEPGAELHGKTGDKNWVFALLKLRCCFTGTLLHSW